ncbi:MAG: hypothetical protein FJ150_01760 [Euryarchaeota archaeon]|nr:hypothetical protein [Euryarchaeota archaeon]
MAENLEKKIKEALNDVKPWQRVPTSVVGVFLVKTPTVGGQETIMVEINPADDQGRPIKRRGIYLRTNSELEKFREIMEKEKLKDLLGAIENMAGLNKGKPIKPVEI